MKTEQARPSICRPFQRERRLAVALFAAASPATVLGACQTQPDRYLGELLEEQAQGTSPPPAAVSEPFGGPPSQFLGRWTGAAQNPLALGGDGDVQAFASGATQIVLELESGEDTGSLVVGTITFGEPAPLPPLDPNIGYPSDAGYERLGYFRQTHEQASGYAGPLPPYEGFAYHGGDNVFLSELSDSPFVDPDNAELADGVLRFSFDTEEVIAPWCELQQPISDGLGGFGCVKGQSWGTDEAGQCSVGFSGLLPEEEAAVLAAGVSLEFEAVDCGKMFLCKNNRCVCDATSCNAYGFERSAAQLLLRRDGDTLVGMFSNVAFTNPRGLALPPGPVYFTRLP